MTNTTFLVSHSASDLKFILVYSTSFSVFNLRKFTLLCVVPVPFWSVVIIAIVALVLLCVICICICKCCCCRKKTAKSSRKDVVDMGKSKFPGSTYNDKVSIWFRCAYYSLHSCYG